MQKITKKDLNQNIKISCGNHKLSNNDNYNFYIFNLPSRSTCPYATKICKDKCFAKYPEHMFKTVVTSRNKNLDESKKDGFVDNMSKHIEYILNSKKNQNKKVIFRLHESGDFYSQDYLYKWIEIANRFKNRDIIFQAYTKSIEFFKNIDLKDINIKILFSIMPDTNEKSIQLAKEKKMSTFEFIKHNNDKDFNGFICNGVCNECMACYTKSYKCIGVKEHGAGIKGKKKHSLNGKFNEYKDADYWKNYNKKSHLNKN